MCVCVCVCGFFPPSPFFFIFFSFFQSGGNLDGPICRNHSSSCQRDADSVYTFIIRRAYSQRTCQGCREEQPNQLAHTFPDGSGCLDDFEDIHHSWFSKVCSIEWRDLAFLFDGLGVCSDCRERPSGESLKRMVATTSRSDTEEEDALCQSILSVTRQKLQTGLY